MLLVLVAWSCLWFCSLWLLCLKGYLPCPDISQAEVVIRAPLSAFLIIHFFLPYFIICWLMAWWCVMVPVPCTQTGAVSCGGFGGWTQRGDAPHPWYKHLICELLFAFIKKHVPGTAVIFGCTVRRHLDRGRTNAAKSTLLSTGGINSHRCTNYSRICSGWVPAPARMRPVPILRWGTCWKHRDSWITIIFTAQERMLRWFVLKHGSTCVVFIFLSPHPLWPSSTGKMMWFCLDWQYSIWQGYRTAEGVFKHWWQRGKKRHLPFAISNKKYL